MNIRLGTTGHAHMSPDFNDPPDWSEGGIVRVTETGCERFSALPREIVVKVRAAERRWRRQLRNCITPSPSS